MYLSFMIPAVLAFGVATSISQEHARFKESSILSSISSGAVDYTMPSSPHITDIIFSNFLASKLSSFGGNGPIFTASPTVIPIAVEVSAPPLNTQASSKELGLSTPEQLITQVVWIHYWSKAGYGADSLVWNDALANSNTHWIGKYAWHIKSTLTDIGELLLFVEPTSVLGVLENFALARNFYKWSTPDSNDYHTSQFTRMVWKSTTQLGCAWNNIRYSILASGPSRNVCRFELNDVLLILAYEYYSRGNLWNFTDWKNHVGDSTSRDLDGGALAPTDLGLSNASSTRSTAHTIASITAASTTATIRTTAAVCSIKTKKKASTLGQSLFTMIIGLIVARSVTTYPSAMVSLLLNSGFAIAIPQGSVTRALSSGAGRDISSASFSMTANSPLHTTMLAAVQSPISPPSPTPTSTSVLSSPPFSPNSVFISGHNTSPTINTQARPEQTGFSSPVEFQVQMLWGINWYRKILNHPDLVWDDALAASSSNWTYLCDFWNRNIVSEHYGYTKERYPLEVDIPGATYNYSIFDVISLWGEAAVVYYNETDGISTGVRGKYNETDTFTQMVWKDTTHLGCGWNNCPATYIVDNGHPWLFVVCEYYPKGNTDDAAVWTYNVGPIKAHAYDQLTSGLTRPSGPASKSVGSTTTTTLGPHVKTIAGVVSSTNLANTMDQPLFVVIITSIFVVGGLI